MTAVDAARAPGRGPGEQPTTGATTCPAAMLAPDRATVERVRADAASRPGAGAPDAHAAWVPEHATSLALTLGRGRMGAYDPTQQQASDGAVWRTIRTPEGPAVARFAALDDRLRCDAWGPGAARVVADAPTLLGGRDDPAGFDPAHPILQAAHRRLPGMRIAGTRDMLHGMLGAILEQRVEVIEAMRSWVRIVRALGDPAPAPAHAPEGLRMLPEPAALLGVEQGRWRAFGVDLGRAGAIRCAAARSRSLQRMVDDDWSMDAVDRALRSLPGIGVWTSAEVRQRVLGDADAVSVGDLHLARDLGLVLAGRALDDAGMLAMLEPWRGHRYRVARLVAATGLARAPRRAPRRTPGPVARTR